MVHLAHNMDFPNEGVEKLLLSIQLLWSTDFFSYAYLRLQLRWQGDLFDDAVTPFAKDFVALWYFFTICENFMLGLFDTS